MQPWEGGATGRRREPFGKPRQAGLPFLATSFGSGVLALEPATHTITGFCNTSLKAMESKFPQVTQHLKVPAPVSNMKHASWSKLLQSPILSIPAKNKWRSRRTKECGQILLLHQEVLIILTLHYALIVGLAESLWLQIKEREERQEINLSGQAKER